MGTSANSAQAKLKVSKTVKDWIRSVRNTNDVFKKASPAEKRVMLAKDVLAAITARRFVAQAGTYQPVPDRPYGCDLQQPAIMNVEGEECQVCAKGALFVSKLDRLNGLKLFQISDKVLKRTPVRVKAAKAKKAKVAQ